MRYVENMTEADNARRFNDVKESDIVSEFLEKHFYGDTENFKRIFSKKEQVQGVDTRFNFHGFDYVCDEKAAIKYRNLQTFSMELSMIPRRSKEGHEKERIEGWFLNENNINNSYMFIWIDKTKDDTLSLSNMSDILVLEMALVRKENIYKYLEELGWTKERLIEKNEKILSNPYEYMGNLRLNGCKFVCSRQLSECPINILLPRKKLIEISDYSKRYNEQ